MKTFQSLFCSVFLIALSLILNSVAFAQKNNLPAGLTEKSSLEEILNWLDKASLPQARIGLEANVKEPEMGEVITTATRYYELAFFSKGFRLDKIDGCKVKLKNDDVELLRYVTGYPDSSKGSLRFKKLKTINLPANFSYRCKTSKPTKHRINIRKKLKQPICLEPGALNLNLNQMAVFFLFFLLSGRRKRLKKR